MKMWIAKFYMNHRLLFLLHVLSRIFYLGEIWNQATKTKRVNLLFLLSTHENSSWFLFFYCTLKFWSKKLQNALSCKKNLVSRMAHRQVLSISSDDNFSHLLKLILFASKEIDRPSYSIFPPTLPQIISEKIFFFFNISETLFLLSLQWKLKRY